MKLVEGQGPDKQPEPLFPLGHIVATPGALKTMEEVGQDALDLLNRHVTGDWGDLGEEDKQENQLSVKEGFRILSAYTLESGDRIWIITEADRSVSTFLLPSEY